MEDQAPYLVDVQPEAPPPSKRKRRGRPRRLETTDSRRSFTATDECFSVLEAKVMRLGFRDISSWVAAGSPMVACSRNFGKLIGEIVLMRIKQGETPSPEDVASIGSIIGEFISDP